MSYQTATDPVIAEVLSRSVSNDGDREAWLAARRTRLSATDMTVVGRSRESTVREHLRKKVTGTDAEFSGNKATEFGKYSEAQLIHSLAGSGWVRGGDLIVHPANPRYACTPDLLGVSFEGELELMECKSSEKDLDPSGKDFKGTRYLEQILWQMFITGAVRNTLKVIQHDGDWSRWANRPSREWSYPDGTSLSDYAPKVIAVHEYVFERVDYEKEIAELVAKAAQALMWLDEITLGVEDEGVEKFTAEQSLEIGAIVRKRSAGAQAEKAGKAKKDEANAELLTLLAEQERRAFSDHFDEIRVTYAPATETVSQVIDMTAAIEADPKLAEELAEAAEAVEAAQLKLSAVRDQWDAHASFYMKAGDPVKSKPTLTVTPPKGRSYE